VNFWASWCIPACVDEHPVLMDTQDRYGEDLRLVGILYGDNPADAREFLVRYGDGGWSNADDPSGAVALAYGVLGPPETFFVDGEGIVRAKHFGPLTAEDVARYLPLIGVTP
jgi:cytochrome c biogenesis protein CcmG/thiol:disulfide interchange protein DsbE